jgi:hypothetical protein
LIFSIDSNVLLCYLADSEREENKMKRETVYLYNGALLDADGECAMAIPHLFASVREAQEWIDDREMTVLVVRGKRQGDSLVAA